MDNSGPQAVLARGVYAALASPRRPSSIDVDTAALLDYLDLVTGAGVDGLVLFGATGEFIHFELPERIRAAGLAIKRSRVPVLVNVSHSTLAGAVSLAGHAVDAGASGLLLMPPYFFTYGENQIFEFYQQFVKLAASRIPIYLYNLPMFTNAIVASLAERLLQTGHFAGVKDSSGDWSFLESLAALRRNSSFQLLAGNESLFVRGHNAGADGIISGVAAALPELVVALNHALGKSDAQRVDQLNRRLAEFMSFVTKFPACVAIRQAAGVRGWGLSQLAVPFDEDTAAEVIGFHGWFREWWPQVQAECNQVPAMRT